MSFPLPKMPLRCHIWHGRSPLVLPPTAAPDLPGTPCQLRLHKQVWAYEAATYAVTRSYLLIVAKGTDLRPGSTFNNPGDLVEAPAGSGEFYVTLAVGDVAKGFPNEYRIALITVTYTGANPPRYPLP